MKKAILVLFISILYISTNSAQIVVQEEPAITKLMQIYKSKSAQTPIIRAWKIQIMATSDRMEMEQTYNKFERLYPLINYSWEHNPPYYQVRVGAFEKKEDLEATLLELKKDFPFSIPVQDDIAKEDLVDF